MLTSTTWRVISLLHNRSYLIHAVKYMISDDHALILYDRERSISTFHPQAWDIIIKADALGMIEQPHRTEIHIPDYREEEINEQVNAE